MTANGWLQIALVFALVLLTARPLGGLSANALDGKKTPFDPVLGPLERLIYRGLGQRAVAEQSWQAYAVSILVFSICSFALLYALLRLQAFLPISPAGQSAVPADLAFNTAISFVSNTNWQSYGSETTLSHLSQMLGLTVQNFLSAAACQAFRATRACVLRRVTERLLATSAM
jgi:K+-transporting ATPase ATPase A chain